MRSFMLMQITFVGLVLGVSKAGLDARSINHETRQPTAATEGRNAFELRLQFKGEWVPCVDIDMHSDYCLALTPAWMLSKWQGFKFYLNNRIVYNCSSSGRCTDHGALFKNTRIKAASEGCKGIPFANINKDLTGKYTAIMEDHEELLTASFNLTFCNREGSEEVTSIRLILRYRGQVAECISQSNHDSFCLTVEIDGQHFTNKAFRCFLRDRLIYNCSVNGECKGHGLLQHNVRPDYVAKDCYGIPFASVVPEAAGKYSCIVEDETLLIKAGFDLHFCNERNNLHLHLRKNDVEVKCIDNQNADTNVYCLSAGSDKLHLYKEYNFTLNGSPVYSCDSSHACSGKGILQERPGQNAIFSLAKGASGNCSGFPITNVDDTMLGNYTIYAKTQSGSVVTDSYMVEFCQGSSVSNETKAQTKETEKCRWSSTDLIFVITAIIFVIAILVICRCNSRLNSQKTQKEKGEEHERNSLANDRTSPKSTTDPLPEKSSEMGDLLVKDVRSESRHEQTLPPKSNKQ